MNTNQTVYDALPYSYIAAGVSSMALMESGLRLLPAFLLITAGLLVLAWRRGARLNADKAVAASRIKRRNKLGSTL